MRSDLAKIDGVSEIETDIGARVCKFKLADKELNLTARLDEFAKTNTHLAKWSFVQKP